VHLTSKGDVCAYPDGHTYPHASRENRERRRRTPEAITAKAAYDKANNQTPERRSANRGYMARYRTTAKGMINDLYCAAKRRGNRGK
jgi:hypothetical protein